MIRRPLNERFVNAVQTGIKVTTIRDKPWPVGKPIMLYHWLGKPYASKQKDIGPIKVKGFWRIRITRHSADVMGYECGKEGPPLWQTEGFANQEEMNDWFFPLVKPGQTVEKHLMLFETLHSKN